MTTDSQQMAPQEKTIAVTIEENPAWTLQGKNVVVVDGTSPGGRETLIQLARKKPKRIVFGCKDKESGDLTKSELQRRYPNVIADSALIPRIVDMSSLDSVRKFAAETISDGELINVLVLNSVINGPFRREETSEGFELAFVTNYLSQFLMAQLLTPVLQKSAPSRILITTGGAYRWCYFYGVRIDDLQAKEKYSPWRQYCETRLANLLLGQKLHETLHESGVSVFSYHVPAISADFKRGPFLTKVASAMQWFSVSKGANSCVYLASAPDIEKNSGGYLEWKFKALWSWAEEPENKEKLWKLSEEMIMANRPIGQPPEAVAVVTSETNGSEPNCHDNKAFNGPPSSTQVAVN